MANKMMRIICLIVSFLFVTCNGKILIKKSSKSSYGDNIKNIRGGSGDNSVSSLDWRYFLAGGLCAATSHGITTPLDVIKTRMQSFPEKYNKGVLNAAKDIITTEGISFLLAGLGPTIVGYGLEGSLKFGFYETFKGIFRNLTPYQFINFLLASVIAGAVASIVLCPMEEARIKMVGESSWSKENLISGLTRLVREDGLLASFKGLSAMLSKQVPYTMGKQVSFDLITKILYGIVLKLSLNPTDLKWIISTLSAFLASIFACLSSQPGDMILTETYKGKGSDRSFSTIIKNIFKAHGLGGFYIGTSARLAHVASIITSQLVLYDIIKAALGLPITGSH